MMRGYLATMMSFYVLTNGLLLPDETDAKMSCVTETHITDLGLDEPPPLKNLTYDPSKTNLVLVCKGSGFVNKTWRTSGTFHEPVMRYMDNVSGLEIQIPCGIVGQCSTLLLACSGDRRFTNTQLSVYTYVYPQCNDDADTVELTNKEMRSGDQNVDDVQQMSPATTAAQMPYFGVILGFAVCFGLAIISCLVVFVQKQCNTRNWSRYFGLQCLARHPDKRPHEMENFQTKNSLTDKHSAIPMMRFTKLRKGSYQQHNQKMGMLYDA